MALKSKQEQAAQEVLKTFERWLRTSAPSRRERAAAQEGFTVGLAAYAAINTHKLNKKQRAFVFTRVLEKFHAK